MQASNSGTQAHAQVAVVVNTPPLTSISKLPPTVSKTGPPPPPAPPTAAKKHAASEYEEKDAKERFKLMAESKADAKIEGLKDPKLR